MAEQRKQVTPSETGKEVQRLSPMRTLSPLDEMDRMMDRMLETFMPRGFPRPFSGGYSDLATLENRMPRVDVIDRDNELLIRAELPGVSKKDLDVSVRDSAVTIKATTEQEQSEEKGDYYRRELSRGTFVRTVALPTEVDSEKAKANFKDGILELTLPKIERAKAHHLTIE